MYVESNVALHRGRCATITSRIVQQTARVRQMLLNLLLRRRAEGGPPRVDGHSNDGEECNLVARHGDNGRGHRSVDCVREHGVLNRLGVEDAAGQALVSNRVGVLPQPDCLREHRETRDPEESLQSKRGR